MNEVEKLELMWARDGGKNKRHIQWNLMLLFNTRTHTNIHILREKKKKCGVGFVVLCSGAGSLISHRYKHNDTHWEFRNSKEWTSVHVVLSSCPHRQLRLFQEHASQRPVNHPPPYLFLPSLTFVLSLSISLYTNAKNSFTV